MNGDEVKLTVLNKKNCFSFMNVTLLVLTEISHSCGELYVDFPCFGDEENSDVVRSHFRYVPGCSVELDDDVEVFVELVCVLYDSSSHC